MADERRDGRKRSSREMILPLVGVLLLLACLIIVILSLLGPATGNIFSDVVSEMQSSPYSADDEPSSGGTRATMAQAPERVILREGSISLVVEDTRSAKESVEGLVGEMSEEGAFVVSSREQGGAENEPPTVYVTIRVPAARFDEVMDQLAEMAVRVLRRDETAQDVTEEYVDLQARLESMEAARDRLRDLMDDAETVEDLLRVEEQLAEREAEVEAIKGRLEYLARSADLSKITITLSPSVFGQPVSSAWEPGETLRKAFTGLVKSFQTAVDLLIYVGVVLLPWLAVAGLVVYVAQRIVRRVRR